MDFGKLKNMKSAVEAGHKLFTEITSCFQAFKGYMAIFTCFSGGTVKFQSSST